MRALLHYRGLWRRQGQSPGAPSFASALTRVSGAQIIQLLSGTVAAVFISRALGPDGRGIYSLAYTAAGSIALVLSLGLPAGLSWLLIKGGSPRRVAIVATAIGACAGLATYFGIVLLFSRSGSFQDVPPSATGLLAGGLLLGSCCVAALNGLSRFGRSSFLVALVGVCSAIATAVVASQTVDATATVWAAASCITLVYLVGLSSLFRLSPTPFGESPSWREVIRFARLSWLGNLVQQLNFRLDILLLGFWRSPSEVGIYAAAVGLAQLLWLVPSAAGQVAFVEAGRTASTASSGADDAANLLLRRATHGGLLSVLGALLLWWAGPWILTLMLGSEFAGAARPLRLLLPGVCGFAIVQIGGNGLAGMGRPGTNTAIASLAAVVTVAGCILLIPRFGASGAALVSSLSYIVSAAATIRILRKLRDRPSPVESPQL